MKFKILIASLLACAGPLFTQPVIAADGGPILTGKVNATVTRDVPLRFNAVIDEVFVAPGDAVEAGTPLLRYHLQAEAKRLLDTELTMGADTENLKGQILNLQRELATVTAERNKTRQLVSSGLGSKRALARLDENVESINDRIALLKTTIAKAESNFEARLKELGDYFGVTLKAGEGMSDELVLTSPIKGYVLSVNPAVNPGQLFAANTSPVQVGQIDPVIVRVPVYETDLGSIKVGDSAEIEIPSLNNRKFKGEVTEIAWSSTDMNVANPSYYMVEITVPNEQLLMKPGFKSVARFTGSGQK